ncbi:MAG TPA: hypothetical protein VFG42_06535 [Baekduia sp.]|uniref:hypothetical protein n=1 Tax=Baekduia sp. TaxID=2600305 RepID=UPI002D765862|nr:hypothetical protein [Baekduia sp.]HET6506427.1 hypothetical protein [Baekduia sp.]
MATIGSARAPRLWRLVALVAAIGVAMVLVVLLARGGRKDDPDPVAGTARIVVDRPGRTVPRSFLGLSVEWDTLGAYAGHRPAALLALLAPLRQAAGSPLRLRVGGDSADQAWWNPGGREPKPPTVLQNLGPGTLDDVAWLARGLGGPVSLGVNLALRDPSNAVALIRAARRELPPGSLAGIEIGNEPDFYTRGRTFVRGGHVHRRLTKFARYTLADYARDAGTYLRALQPVAGGAALTVAGFAAPAWWPALPAMLHQWGGRAGALAAHLYAEPNCEAPTPKASWLAGRASSRTRVASLRPLLRIGREEHLPVNVSELNTFACGGRPGLSNRPVAALWTADTLMALARAGVHSATLHTWAGAAYAPFVVHRDGRVTGRPPLTGMLAFARAAPSGSHVVRTITTGAVRGGSTVDRDGTARLLLITRRQATATIRVTHAGSTTARRTGCATAWQAPPSGRPRTSRVCPGANGTLSLSMPATSLAVVTIPHATAV